MWFFFVVVVAAAVAANKNLEKKQKKPTGLGLEKKNEKNGGFAILIKSAIIFRRPLLWSASPLRFGRSQTVMILFTSSRPVLRREPTGCLRNYRKSVL